MQFYPFLGRTHQVWPTDIALWGWRHQNSTEIPKDILKSGCFHPCTYLDLDVHPDYLVFFWMLLMPSWNSPIFFRIRMGWSVIPNGMNIQVPFGMRPSTIFGTLAGKVCKSARSQFEAPNLAQTQIVRCLCGMTTWWPTILGSWSSQNVGCSEPSAYIPTLWNALWCDALVIAFQRCTDLSKHASVKAHGPSKLGFSNCWNLQTSVLELNSSKFSQVS